MLLFGILCGLGCAVCQSLSYLATRHYVQGRLAMPNASRQLLVLAHLWMGLFSCILLPMVWPAGGVPWSKFLPPFFANIFCYAAGQISLASALKHAEASRVSPLMTAKLILSSILVILYGKLIGGPINTVTPLQVLAVGLCIVAGIAVNFSGGRMKTKAILAIAAAAISFSLSDWSINLTIADLQSPAIDRNQASMLTLAFTYMACGLLVIPLVIPLGSRKGKRLGGFCSIRPDLVLRHDRSVLRILQRRPVAGQYPAMHPQLHYDHSRRRSHAPGASSYRTVARARRAAPPPRRRIALVHWHFTLHHA